MYTKVKFRNDEFEQSPSRRTRAAGWASRLTRTRVYRSEQHTWYTILQVRPRRLRTALHCTGDALRRLGHRVEPLKSSNPKSSLGFDTGSWLFRQNHAEVRQCSSISLCRRTSIAEWRAPAPADEAAGQKLLTISVLCFKLKIDLITVLSTSHLHILNLNRVMSGKYWRSHFAMSTALEVDRSMFTKLKCTDIVTRASGLPLNILQRPRVNRLGASFLTYCYN